MLDLGSANWMYQLLTFSKKHAGSQELLAGPKGSPANVVDILGTWSPFSDLL